MASSVGPRALLFALTCTVTGSANLCALASPQSCGLGFGFDPSDDVVVSGSIGTTAAAGGPCDSDSVELDETFDLTSCGNADVDDSRNIMSACDVSWRCEDAEGSASFSTAYTLSLSSSQISATIGSLGQYHAEYSRYCAMDFEAAWGTGATNEQIGITFPFVVTSRGTLIVQEAILTVQGCGPDNGSVIVNAAWSIQGPVDVDWEHGLDACGSDQYAGDVEIPLPPGEYVFSLSYDSWSSVSAGCTTIGCGPIIRDYQATDLLELSLLFSCEGFTTCDSNCDGVINNFDVDAFVLALSDPEEYASTYPDCSLRCNNDANGDGYVNNLDVDAFIDCLGG